MARNIVLNALAGIVACGLLSACVETSTTIGGASPASGSARSGAEVEAPEVFQASEPALWDGRPSLGGIWVASPDAVDPERVVMFNPATGKTVKGALFKRERENPGPRLQLSSDAAEALGVLAGMPTEIQVTALRKVEVAEEAPPAAPEPVTEGASAETDAASVAAAALEAVDADEGVAPAADAEPAAEGEAVEAAPRKKTWKEKRAEAKAAREAEKAAAAAAAAGEAGAAGTDEAPVTPDAVAGGTIEAAPLDADSPAATEPGKSATAASGSTADEASSATAGGTRSIQIGSFSKEENANRAIEALSKIGIEATSKKVEKDGKIYWGVVAKGDESLLNKIKAAGFADAYFLK